MLSPSSSPLLAALPAAVDRRFGAVAASLVLAGGLLLGGAVLAADAPAAAPRVPVMNMGAQAVGAGLELDGSLQAVRQSTLSAQASGRIAQLSVKAGDRVKAGQVLAVIDDRATQASVAPSVDANETTMVPSTRPNPAPAASVMMAAPGSDNAVMAT